MKKFNHFKKKKKKKKRLKNFLSCIKTKVAIKFPKKLFFFSAENRIGAEKVNDVKFRLYSIYFFLG